MSDMVRQAQAEGLPVKKVEALSPRRSATGSG
jgi:hypothetical protein